jgi:hypothetical protein
VARIVAKAMARSPRHRYATAADLARDLEAFNRRRLTSVDGWAPWLGLSLYVQRNRELVMSVATLTLFLVLFAGAVGWLRVQSLRLRAQIGDLRDEITQIDARRAEASRAEAEAKGLRDRAIEDKEAALDSAAAAKEASELAAQGQSAAEARAAQAIAEQIAAQKARDEAERGRAEAQLARDEAIAGQLRAEARADLADEAAAEAKLRAETAEREQLRSEQAGLETTDALQARIDALQARIDFLEQPLGGLAPDAPQSPNSWPLIDPNGPVATEGPPGPAQD